MSDQSSAARQQSGPKQLFAVMQVVDESGSPIAFDKTRLKVVFVARSAEQVIDIAMGDGEHQFVTKITVPPPTIQRTKGIRRSRGGTSLPATQEVASAAASEAAQTTEQAAGRRPRAA